MCLEFEVLQARKGYEKVLELLSSRQLPEISVRWIVSDQRYAEMSEGGSMDTRNCIAYTQKPEVLKMNLNEMDEPRSWSE